MSQIVVRMGVRLKRSERRNGWTKARRAAFLDLFAATGNVRASAIAIGLDRGGVYALRRRDAGFARLFEEARQQAHDLLEDEVLRRALTGTGDDENPSGERADVEPVAFDVELAIRTLKLRDGSRGRAGTTLGPTATQERVDAVLLERLDALADKLVAREAAPVASDTGGAASDTGGAAPGTGGAAS